MTDEHKPFIPEGWEPAAMVNHPAPRLSVSGIDPRQRVLLLALRQALLIMLGAIEEFLGIERSVVPRHRRE